MIRVVSFSAAAVLAAALLILPHLGLQFLNVQSGSMSPAIKKGDMVAVSSVSNSEVRVGDVVTFISSEDPNINITHRVLERPNKSNGFAFITKGDANPASDDPIDPERVIGKVELSVPNIGSAINIVSQPLFLLALFYIPMFIVVAEEFGRLVKHFRQSKPWRDPKFPEEKPGFSYARMLVLGLFIFGTAGAVPVFAQLADTAVLSGNTLTSADLSDLDICPNGNESSVSVSIGGNVGGSNTNNIEVSNSTDQSATSGSATVSGNSSGGSAQSGDAINCNSTNIDIDVNN